jgi:RNA polymerase sigma factor (sigma-70 family)
MGYAALPITDDTMTHYLAAVGRHELLTAEEEVALAQAIEAGRDARAALDAGVDDPRRRRELGRLARKGDEARRRFLEANLRLVVSVARRYGIQHGMDLIDLVQEGNLGLMRAVEKFDWRKGFKFSTYATWWIRQALSRALAEKSRTVRIPASLHDQLSAIRSARARFQAETGRTPTVPELAEEAGVDERIVEEALSVAESVSLENPIGEDGAVLADFVTDGDEPDPAEVAEQSMISEELQRAIGRLAPREQRILRMRFGFDEGIPLAREEIGRKLGLSPERILQLEKLALTRLRHPSFGLREETLI